MRREVLRRKGADTRRDIVELTELRKKNNKKGSKEGYKKVR